MVKKLDIKTCMDIGCAQPFLIKEFNKLGLEISGSDISEPIIEDNKKLFSNINFFVLDISKPLISVPNKKFDLVTCCEVIEHIDDYKTAIKNICLMSNKYLLITVPGGKKYPLDENFGHFRHFTIRMISDELEKNNFKVIISKQRGFPFFSLYRKIITLQLTKSVSEQFLSAKYTLIEKIVSHILYGLFFLNVFNIGSQLFILAKYDNVEVNKK
jgi:hypothetical protein